MSRHLVLFAFLLSIAIPRIASAQHMYLDTNGDGLSTAADQIDPNGPTTLDVWLRTNTNREGSPAECVTQDGELTINSYEFILHADGGTVSWSGFTNHQPDFNINLGLGESATDYHNGYGGGVILPPGTYRIASLTLTVTLGTPSISFASSTPLSGVYLTSFGSRCSGNDFDNTLKLGSDWFDTDGAPYGGVPNAPPALTPPSDMTVNEGSVADQELTATDPEGGPISFELVSGPFYAEVTTVDPGTGTGTGRVRLTPNLQDAGTTTATIRASDGILTDTESFAIVVTNVNRAPVLIAIPDVTMAEGQLRELVVSATDADQDPLVFTLPAAPRYVRIQRTGPAVARVSISPGHADAGEASATVQVSDGVLTDSQVFQITVNEALPVHNQILCPPGDMLVPQGQIVEQPLHAVSPGGSSVQFFLVSGPSYVTVSTTSSEPSNATGLVRVAPSATEAGSATVEVAAADGIATDTRSFQISVGAPAVLPDPTKPLFLGDHHASGTGGTPQSVATADLDGDGALDLVTANLSGSLTIARGTGRGDFVRRDDYPLPQAPVSADIGDLNADGRPDIVVADRGREVVSVLFGTGECQFGNRIDLATPPIPVHVKLADWTADGVLDLVVSDEDSDAISFFRGRGDGSFFQEHHFPVGVEPCYADDGDFDRDGHLDMVIANEGSNDVSVLLGNGDGTFQAHVAYQEGEATGADEVGDFNGDEVLDLAAVNFESHTVSVLLGVGDGTFLPHVQYPCGRTPWHLAIGDLNGDGHLDMVTANVVDNTITVLFGTGAGTFLPPVAEPVGLLTRAVTLADVNEDGALDVVVVNEGSDTVVTLLGNGDSTWGRTGFPVEAGPYVSAPGDWNADGIEDLIVGSVAFETNASALQVHLGAGAGTFTPGQKFTGLRASRIVSGDWNGDQVPDLAVTSQDPGQVSIFAGVGNGTFQIPVHHLIGGVLGGIVPIEMTGDGVIDLAVSHPNVGILPFANDGAGSFTPLWDDTLSAGGQAIIGGDWNGDGRTDLAAVEGDRIRLLLRSDQGFTRLAPVPLSRLATSLLAGDFDDDHRLDLAVGTFVQVGTIPFVTTQSTIEILLGNGDGTFGPPRSLTAEPVPSQIHSVDANGDGHDDIVVGSGLGISLLLGYGNGDFVNKVDFGSFAAHGISPGDWSGDGRVDLAVPSSFKSQVAIWINQGTFPVVSNRAPVADAGGPYAGSVGTPIAFDGTGSSDLDGDPLSMTWNFGDGASGAGGEPVHTYHAAGAFSVTLTVSDGHASDEDVTTATIGGMLEARAFTLPEDGTFRLFAGKPSLTVRLEPVSSNFELSQIDLGSVRLRSEGTGSVDEIGAAADKGAPLLDRDRNGVLELKLSFALDDVRLIFASVSGKQDVPVSIEGSSTDGSPFRGEAVLRVIGAPGFPAAFAAPNPMNPSATLFVATSKPGRLRASLYDSSGRRVRVIADLSMVLAGVHEFRFDGRSDHGASLASGIYFYLVESAEGTTRGRISILK